MQSVSHSHPCSRPPGSSHGFGMESRNPAILCNPIFLVLDPVSPTSFIVFSTGSGDCSSIPFPPPPSDLLYFFPSFLMLKPFDDSRSTSFRPDVYLFGQMCLLKVDPVAHFPHPLPLFNHEPQPLALSEPGCSVFSPHSCLLPVDSAWSDPGGQ